jgi:hypothetical protein
MCYDDDEAEQVDYATRCFVASEIGKLAKVIDSMLETFDELERRIQELEGKVKILKIRNVQRFGNG